MVEATPDFPQCQDRKQSPIVSYSPLTIGSSNLEMLREAPKAHFAVGSALLCLTADSLPVNSPADPAESASHIKRVER